MKFTANAGGRSGSQNSLLPPNPPFQSKQQQLQHIVPVGHQTICELFPLLLHAMAQ